MVLSCEPPFRIYRLQWIDFRSWQESSGRYEDLKKKLLTAVAECLVTGRAPLRKWERLPEPWDFTAFFASLVHANPAGQILAMLDEARVAADPASAFEVLILNLLNKLPEPADTPRFLLIDALDEALALPGSSSSSLNLLELLSSRLAALPSWLKIVATTRDDPFVKRRFRTANLLPLDAATQDNERDLRAYVSARLEAEPLFTKAGDRRREIGDKVLARGTGNFLVVAQTLDAVESGLLVADDLDTLAPGLHPLYEGFFDRLYKRAGVDFAPARLLLQCILAAQEPPLREELAAVTGLDAETDLPLMLSHLASMVPPRSARYSPYHKTLAEWLTGWNAREDQPIAGEYYISLKKGHRLWRTFCCGDIENPPKRGMRNCAVICRHIWPAPGCGTRLSTYCSACPFLKPRSTDRRPPFSTSSPISSPF